MTGQTFSHYRVLERLGSGGMGEVYRAEDLRLGRFVALKTLPDPTVAAAGPGDAQLARRLLAEARAASALVHPNIAVVYEADEAECEGRLVSYIAMEYVAGITLAELLRRGVPPLDETLDLMAQVADGLAEAHRQGLVHRDIKPSNVMVTPSGLAKILDFGVAGRVTRHAAGPDDPTRLADDAFSRSEFVGTLPYVAPEQATGREVDGRADMFSLGVVLYELASGTRPFAAANAAQMLEAILRADVAPLPNSGTDNRLADLDRVVRRMLARDPEQRLSSLADVRDALTAIRRGAQLPASLEAAADTNTVVVAAFVNISGDPEDDWLGAGIAETLTADADQIEGVSVIPRERISAVLKTLGAAGDRDEALLLRAARELRARWMVTGGFQRAGQAVRVTASLVDVRSGERVRTTKIDGMLSAIFDLQDRIVRELASALRTAVQPAAAGDEGTDVVEAYEAFSRGLLNRRAGSIDAMDRAVWFFERAVTLDPAYARAHVELGASYAWQGDYLSLPAMYPRAIASLRRGIDLQPATARGWRELGLLLVLTQKVDEGMSAIRRALTIDPDDATAISAMGRVLFIGRCRFREAADWFERALERDPKGGWYALQLAHCAALVRDFATGEQAAQRAIALQEEVLSGREGLFIVGAYIRAGHLAALQGRHAEALEYFLREIDFLGRAEHALRERVLVELNARIGAAYVQLGEPRKAQAAFAVALESFDRRVRLGADDPFTRFYAASVHAMKGEAEPALAYLERGIAQLPLFTAARARVEPEFESLRTDPRFTRLVASGMAGALP